MRFCATYERESVPEVVYVELDPSSFAIRFRFGKAARKLRHDLGVSQEEFADICGLDRTYIGGIERGERNVSLINIERICESNFLLRRPFRTPYTPLSLPPPST